MQEEKWWKENVRIFVLKCKNLISYKVYAMIWAQGGVHAYDRHA